MQLLLKQKNERNYVEAVPRKDVETGPGWLDELSAVLSLEPKRKDFSHKMLVFLVKEFAFLLN